MLALTPFEEDVVLQHSTLDAGFFEAVDTARSE